MNLYNQAISDFIATGRRVPKFISLKMISSNKAFILPHLEYCAPFLVALLSSIWCFKLLELTNQFAIRALMNKLKSTSCSDLLTLVDLKTPEHRRYSQALDLCHKCMYNMGPNYCKEMLLSRQSENDLRGFRKVNHLTYNFRYVHRS